MQTEKDKVPKDCYWSKIPGGGNYVYFIRPAKFNDPKVYGVEEL